MKLFNSIQTSESSNAEINMSPLVDMVFLLLIFFMVTTVFVKETGVEVKKPVASTAESVSMNSVMVAITHDGRIVYSGNDISLRQLSSQIKLALGGKDIPVLLLADEAVPTGLLVQAVDQCKLGGARQVNVAAMTRD